MQMEVAVHDSFFAKIRILTELANRECVLRVSNQGRVLPAFKAKTLDVLSVPRVKEDKIKEYEIIEKKEKIKKKKFLIETAIDIQEIMKSQSTGRRKLANNE